MGLLGDLLTLVGPAAGPPGPMPRDCEDPAQHAGLTPSVDDLLGRATGGLLGDLRGAGERPPTGPWF